MSAPTTGCAKVDSTGIVTTLGPKPTPDAVVRADDVQDAPKLARIVERLLANVASLKSRWYPRRVDYEDVSIGRNGAIAQLAHNLAGRVRWSVQNWSTAATPTTDNFLCYATTWMMRGLWGPGTLTYSLGNFTTGIRFRATSTCLIAGARFLWKSNAKTVKATLWLDSSGAVLATGTATCVDSGVYVVTFATAVIPTLNVDMTLGIYDQAGSVYTHTGTDAAFTVLLPLTVPGLSLQLNKLWSAGDARPTSSSATELYWVEPLLTPATPQLIESSATDGNTLVLTSYVPGTATIRVEAAG